MTFDIIIGRSESDKKKFGNKGVVFIGKSYVKMGRTTSLSNNVYLDVVRGHVIFVVGKRGSGKCVTGDTLIPLNDGSLSPISELANNQCSVYSLNESLKVAPAEKSEFFEREVEAILHVKLRSGREIKLTPEHPLLTIKGWKEAQELKIGSRIATERKISCFGKDIMEEHKVKIIAYLIAEGHLSNGFVLFANSDPKIVNDFSDSIRKFDNNLAIKSHGKYNYRIVQKEKLVKSFDINRDKKGQFTKGSGVRYQKNSLRLWLEEIGLYKKLAKEKFIPDAIFKLPKEQLGLFLNRLFSCDGSIYKSDNHYEIAYASFSKRLIMQVQHLLLRFGVLSKVRKKQVKCNSKLFEPYELNIESENILTFVKEIGFHGGKKEKEQPATDCISSKRLNPNADTIPKELWETYRPKSWAAIGRAVGYKHPKAMRERIRYCPSRQTLLQVAKVEKYNPLYLLATSDIFWDEVTSIDLLEGKFKVYDLCVPELHNFVANDIIVHNSYTLGVIAEGMIDLPDEIKKNLSIILLDTMGIYWTMKYPNEKDADLLQEWGLQSKGLDVKIFTPYKFYEKYKEEGMPTDYPFSIKPTELTAEDWSLTFGLKPEDPVTVIIEKIIGEFEERGVKEYDIDDITELIRADKEIDVSTKNSAINHFKAAKRWGLFKKEGTELDDLTKGGQVSILDVSCYTTGEGGWGVKNLVLGLVAKKMFVQRMIERKKEELDIIKRGFSYFKTEEPLKETKPIIWLVLDEAHEALPQKGKSPATDSLVTILREGRQPGVCLILCTQQPGKIHGDVMTQSDIVISHRITAKPDIEALNSMMQSYMAASLTSHLNNLPRESGAGIVLDDNSERIFPIRIRPRFTWHGGESPTAIPPGRELETELGKKEES